MDYKSSKSLICLAKQPTCSSKSLILRAHEIGTFCIDCTGTPARVRKEVQGWRMVGTVECDGLGRCVTLGVVPTRIIFLVPLIIP